MRARLEAFALSLHPDKTRIIEFGRHAAKNRAARGVGKPETFNFLGFTFICGTSRRGKFLIHRKSRRDRVRAKLKALKDKVRMRMHRPLPETGKWLGQVVRGFLNYHAVPTNSRAIDGFREAVLRLWLRALRRRSNRDKTAWDRFRKLAEPYLPTAQILHPWPEQRFAVRHPRQEPYAGCERKAGTSLPVKVWSVQSRAGGTGASLAGVAATRGPKRRQRLDGVWN
jgi:hypothetical protein